MSFDGVWPSNYISFESNLVVYFDLKSGPTYPAQRSPLVKVDTMTKAEQSTWIRHPRIQRPVRLAYQPPANSTFLSE
jgi:beta-galactosidase/beta-glucuronidase